MGTIFPVTVGFDPERREIMLASVSAACILLLVGSTQ